MPPTARQAMPRQANATHEALAAERGVSGQGHPLPHADRIQAAFGRHDVSAIVSHHDSAARDANGAMGSVGYATGNHVAFKGPANLHTAAHEAAHVIQQQAGVQLKGGVGRAGDTHERHADAVADAVVGGRSAEALLDRYAGGSGHPVQRRQLQFQQVTTPAPQAAPTSQSAPGATQANPETAERRRGEHEGPARSASGPIAASAWEHPGRDILPRLSQRPAMSVQQEGVPRGTEEHVCGAASLLANEIMAGREATARFLEQTANTDDLSNHNSTLPNSEWSQQYQQHVVRLRAIAARVREGTATFGDLNDAQQRVYLVTRRRLTAPGTEQGLDDRMVNRAARNGRENTRSEQGRISATANNSATLLDTLTGLAPGVTVTRRIRSGRRENTYNHFITLGRRTNGQPWYYNPDPAPGDAQTVTGRIPSGPDDDGMTAELTNELDRLTSENRAGAETVSIPNAPPQGPHNRTVFPGATTTRHSP